MKKVSAQFQCRDTIFGDRNYYLEGKADATNVLGWHIQYGLEVNNKPTLEGYLKICRGYTSGEVIISGIFGLYSATYCQVIVYKYISRILRDEETHLTIPFTYDPNSILVWPLVEFEIIVLCTIISDVSDVIDLKFVGDSETIYGKADYLKEKKLFKGLSDEFGNLFQNSWDTDIVLKCGREAIPAHRCVLAARSPFFAAALEKEPRKSYLKVKVVGPLVLKAVLKYIYTANVGTLFHPRARYLLEGAHEFQLLSLKKTCIDFYKSGLSTDNVLYMFSLGHRYDQDLKKMALDLLSKDISLLEHLITDKWKTNYPTLETEAINYCKEAQHFKTDASSKSVLPLYTFFILAFYFLLFGCKFDYFLDP